MIEEGIVEGLAFGGKGLLRMPDRYVIFIPFTIPKERILFQIEKRKKNYAQGKLVEILEASPSRITPLCPYFGTCGGCQLQHMEYPLQLSYKLQTVKEALQRLFPHIEPTIVSAEPIWAYRSHITLTLKPSIQGFITGYYAIDNETVFPVNECPIFQKSEDPIIKICANLASELNSHPENFGKLKIIKTPQERYILAFHFPSLPSNFGQVAANYLGNTIQGIHASSQDKKLVLGNIYTDLTIENFQIRFHPSAFSQNHLKLSHHLYLHLQQLIRSHSPTHLLDLYSGIGVTSLLASSDIPLISAVEMNGYAVDAAKECAERYKIKNIHFHKERVESILSRLLSKKPNMALVNPPRTGLSSEVADKLSKSTIKQLIYVSCHPATLMRDLAVFKQNGFACTNAKVFDMFPQTGHVETVTVLNSAGD